MKYRYSTYAIENGTWVEVTVTYTARYDLSPTTPQEINQIQRGKAEEYLKEAIIEDAVKEMKNGSTIPPHIILPTDTTVYVRRNTPTILITSPEHLSDILKQT